MATPQKTGAVTLELKDQTVSGRVTNMDALFFIALILPDYDQIVRSESGLLEAWEKFSADARDAIAVAEDKKALADAVYSEWGERMLIRLSTNITIRNAFAQRTTEIFPDIKPELVRYVRWMEGDRTYENGAIRLDMEDLMVVIQAMAYTLTEEDAKKGKSKAPDETQKLLERIAQLETKLEQTA